jgi:pentatricopeptide repeat protein
MGTLVVIPVQCPFLICSDYCLAYLFVKPQAQSTRPDAFEHAAYVFELLSDHPKCKERNIRPDTDSYVALLRCLSGSEGKLRMEAGKRAITLLNEIEAAANAGLLRLNRTCFNLVVKACLRSNEEGLAWDLISRMKKSKDCQPNIRTYNEILAFFSRKGTLQAARKADELLYELAKNAKKTLAEDAYAVIPNAHSYLAVVNAWAKADCSRSARRLVSLYKHMVGFHAPFNQHIYIAIIRYLANDSLDSSVRHAQKILEDMEENEQSGMSPDYRHYLPVLRGYIFNSKMKSATNILFRSVDAYIRTKNRSVAPNSAMVNMVVQGWMRDNDNIIQASEVANKMAQLKNAGQIPEGPDQSVFRTLLTQWKDFQLMHPDRLIYIRLLEARLEEVKIRERSESMKSLQRFSFPL